MPNGLYDFFKNLRHTLPTSLDVGGALLLPFSSFDLRSQDNFRLDDPFLTYALRCTYDWER